MTPRQIMRRTLDLDGWARAARAANGSDVDGARHTAARRPVVPASLAAIA